jgi:hypothetical protein
MFTAWAMVLLSLAPTTDDATTFLAAVEKVELRINGEVYPRIERDALGQVTRLRLEGMELAPADFRIIGQLPSVRYLSLLRTNATSADIGQLRGMASLEYLVLSSTPIDDKAVEHLVELPALRTLCMGQVAVTPAAIEVLKLHKPRLSLGYSPR